MLKALLLASVSPRQQRRLRDELRGSRGHNLEWLGGLYRQLVPAAVPVDVVKHWSRLASWSTDLRYTSGLVKRGEADEFMSSVVAVVAWADGRM